MAATAEAAADSNVLAADGSDVETLSRHNKELRAEILLLKTEIQRLSKGGGAKAGKKPPSPPPTELAGTATRVVDVPAPALNDDTGSMELDPTEAVTIPPLIMRPPIKGVSKQLGEYPPEIRDEESRDIYDHLTGQINALLSRREDLKKGTKPQFENPPPRKTSLQTTPFPRNPFPLNLYPAARQYAGVKETSASAKGGGASSKKKRRVGKRLHRNRPQEKNPPPSSRQYAEVLKASVPAGGGEEGHRRGRGQQVTRTLAAQKLPAQNTELPASSPAPLPQPSSNQESWAKVVGRKAARKAKAALLQPAPASLNSRGRANKASPPLSHRRG